MIINIKKHINKDKHLLDLLSAGFVSFVFQIFGILVGYLFILLVSKIYGANALGIFTLTLTTVNIIILFAKFGFDSASVKFVAENAIQNKFNHIKLIYFKILKFIIPLNIFLSLLLFYSASTIAVNIFHKDNMTYPLQLFALLILPITLRIINANSLRGLKEIKYFSFLQTTIVYSIALIIIFVSSFFDTGYMIIFYAYFIGIYFAYFFSQFLWIYKLNILTNTMSISTKANVKILNLVKIAYPMLISNSLMLVIGWSDIMILGIFRSQEEVGIYSVVIKIASILSIGLSSINTISEPKFAEAYGKKSLGDIRNIAQSANKLIFIVTTPIVLIIFIFSDKILAIFGTEFIAGSYALIFLLLGRFVDSLTGTSGGLLRTTGNQKIQKNIILIAAIINIILNFFLIPKYGIEGASIASMLSMLCWSIGYIYYINKFYNFINLPFYKGNQ